MNTAAIGDVSSVRFGLAEAVDCGPITVVTDCFVLSETYIGPEGGETKNLNVIVSGEGSTSPGAGVDSYPINSPVLVTATSSLGWEFDHWVLDSVIVGSTNPIQITMDTNHNLEAVFTFVQTPVHDVFSVASNSMVSDLSFDSSSKQLSFTVSGADGTMGIVEVTISKELVGDTSGLQVLLDGVVVPFDVVSVGDSWLVSFSYHHSQHRVQIKLENTEPSINLTFYSFVLLSAFLIAHSMYDRRIELK